VSEQGERAQALARRLLPAIWAGALLCIALLATPAPFATLAKADAGRVVAHIFVREAWLSLLLGAALLALARREAASLAESRQGSQFSTEMLLALGTIFCTVMGYFALQPMMAAAKSGEATPLSFGQLHGLSFGLFGLKMALVCWLAVRAARR
jgi:cation transport ATPase